VVVGNLSVIVYEHFSIRGNKTTKENTKTDHRRIIIKPPLQYNYNTSSGSSMHECFNTTINKMMKEDDFY
jgi:hypothetical protein